MPLRLNVPGTPRAATGTPSRTIRALGTPPPGRRALSPASAAFFLQSRRRAPKGFLRDGAEPVFFRFRVSPGEVFVDKIVCVSSCFRGLGDVSEKQSAIELSARLRAEGKRVVFTNGVFDLLHPGHVRYLQHARALGDALIVGLNSDRSVGANKGAGRPITPEAERAEILAALACVDAVVVFDEDTPHAIIAAVQPDVLVKGADWADNAIVGRDVVDARGGRVVRIPVEPGYSTSAIIARIKRSTTRQG